MKRARRYDVHVPVKYNDGRPVEPRKLTAIRSAVVDQFSGLTQMPGNEGIWMQAGVVYVDQIMILSVSVPATKSNRTFFQQLKEDMKQSLAQEEVFITEQELIIL